MEKLFEKIKKDSAIDEVFEKHLDKDDQKELQLIFLKCLEEKCFNLAKICLKYMKTINFGDLRMCNNDSYRSNPMFVMCGNGNLEAVKFLVENGADIEKISALRDKTAIMYAFEEGKTDVVKYLLSKGAKTSTGSINMTDCYDKSSVVAYVELIKFYDAWVRKLMGKIMEISNEKSMNQTEEKLIEPDNKN